jgi:hypothetical protein
MKKTKQTLASIMSLIIFIFFAVLTSTSAYGQCAPGCINDWIGDNECDEACDVAACNYDDGDCAIPNCAPGCFNNYIGDGECNSACNVSACNYDDGDCGSEDPYIALKDYNLSIWDISGTYCWNENSVDVCILLIQDAKGKVTGYGRADGYGDYGMVNVDYEVKGKVKGSNNIVKVKLTVQGTGYQGSNEYKSKEKSSIVINKNSLTMEGPTKEKECLKGFGCDQETGYDTIDLPDGMTGKARLLIDAEPNLTGQKFEGTGELILSNQDKYPLYFKGKYNSKNDETKFSLKGVDESTKGIKFKLTIDEGSEAATSIKGKVLGQKLIY